MKILLKKSIRVSPKEEKTNIFIPFSVPESIEKIEIDYSYSPKDLEDEKRSRVLIKENLIRDGWDEIAQKGDYKEFMPLKNLITLSVDSPEGYVGAAHRQAPQQHHEISEKFASVGFDKLKITAGEWTLALNLHAVVTDEVCCEIEVRGYE